MMSVADERLLGIGVDGAPRRWVAVGCFGPGLDASAEQRRSEPHFFVTIEELAAWRASQPGAENSPVAVDIPTGLPETVSYRPCDREARDRLGVRRGSVFQPPARYLLSAAERIDGKVPKPEHVFARVQELVAERKDVAGVEAKTAGAAAAKVLGLSRQAAGILLKVAEVDARPAAPPRPRAPRVPRCRAAHPRVAGRRALQPGRRVRRLRRLLDGAALCTDQRRSARPARRCDARAGGRRGGSAGPVHCRARHRSTHADGGVGPSGALDAATSPDSARCPTRDRPASGQMPPP